jgi:DNA polymerase bacteriophage-type
MCLVWLDIETYSECDLPAAGSYLYARHPTTELLIVTWAAGDGPVQIWDVTSSPNMPHEFAALYYDPDTLLCAWNSNFDRNVLNELIFETPLSRWRDSMVKALLHGLPGALDKAGKALGLPEEQAKLVDGRKLVNRFCMPAPSNHNTRRYTRDTHPEEWARFCEYAKRDIDAMRTIDRLIPDLNTGPELQHWHLDQVINDRGFLADRELAIAGANAADVEQACLAQRMRELTAGRVEKPSQRQRLLDYLTEHGCPLPDLTKTTVAYAIADERISADARELLELRQQSSKTSTAKYRALRDAIGDDGRFRGGIQFAGAARTRRAAGRKFQAQNLPSRDLPPAREVAQYIDALKLGIHQELFA